jgi:S-adenosylmethionine hydrolase
VSKPPNRCCLTFLTDFGVRDTYVGQMKGVALSINPDAQLVDLSHEIPPQQILRGAFIWSDAVAAFSRDAIHVGVVDPGVGSNRRLIAAEVGEYRFVCPDNGLLSVILQREKVRRAVCLDERRWWRTSVSNTFHGRDILTAVAAAWSLGHDLEELGSPVTTPLVTLPLANLIRGRTSLTGQIINVDRFGNLITNINSQELPRNAKSFKVEVGSFRIDGVATCYADVEPGEMIALAGSANRIEIAIRDGNAADELQVDCGRRVVVRWTESNE